MILYSGRIPIELTKNDFKHIDNKSEVYLVYAAVGEDKLRRELTALVYACNQCGHLEKFVDPETIDETTR